MDSLFSPFSEVVILFSLSAPAWFVLLLFWPRSPRRAVGAAVVMVAWAAFGMAVVRYGWDVPPFGSSPVRALFQLAAPTLLILLAARWLTTPPVSQRLLVALQLFRVIGAVFLVEWYRGVVPGVFAWPAGVGDIAVASIAATILIRYRNRPIPRRALVVLAVAGIADFISAFSFGFLSAESPVQLFAFDLPNTANEYPLGLIPNCLVPVALAAHILSLAQLNRAEAPKTDPASATPIRAAQPSSSAFSGPDLSGPDLSGPELSGQELSGHVGGGSEPRPDNW